MKIEGQEFRRQSVNLSAAHYVRCKFVDCEVMFDGTGPAPVECGFTNCRLGVSGSAVHTIRFLHHFWTNGGFGAVEELGVMMTGAPLRFGEQERKQQAK